MMGGIIKRGISCMCVVFLLCILFKPMIYVKGKSQLYKGNVDMRDTLECVAKWRIHLG